MVEVVIMRKVYLGYPQELEKKLYDDIVAAKCDDIFYPVVVVVPSNLSGVYLRRSLARCGGSHCRVRFLTLADLAAELAAESPDYALRKAMPPFGEEWLAALTAREAAGGYFDPVAGRPGFCEVLQQTFQELEEAGLEQVPLPRNGDPRRIAELQRLYEHYRKLRRPFTNRGATLTAAARATPPGSFKVALYGIYQLSALEKKLLASLAAHNGMAVYWQKSAFAFAPVKQAWPWFQQQGFTLEHLMSSRARGSNLERLQKNLFQPSPDSSAAPVGDQSLEFICAPDEVREVEEITREIINLAHTGMRFGEMAVLLPHMTYAGLFRERFAAAGIPCYLSGGLPLAQTRSGRSFLLLLQLIGSDYPRLKVIELLTYAPFDYQRILDCRTPVNPAFWDYVTIEAGVIKGRRQWREALELYCQRLQRQIREYKDEGSAAGERRARRQLAEVELLLSFLQIFFDLLERFHASRSWADLTAVAGELIGHFFHPGEERETLLQLLKRLQRLDECGGEFDLKPALELLQSALQTTALPHGKFQQEGVNLLPLGSAAGLRFSALFIPGLAEKIIPAPVKADPLLPEAERLMLSGELPLRRHKLELEALWFTLALGGAVRKAVLTWPRASAAGGREQLPSFFLSRCGEALCGTRPGYEQLSLLPGYRYISAVPEKETVVNPVTMAEYDLNCCHSFAPSLQPLQYYRRLSPALNELLEADLARLQQRLSSYDGIFTQSASQNLLSARLAGTGGFVSVTALEDYARCPYSYFLKRLLGLTSLEEPEELLDMAPLARGRLLHRILEEFYRSASEQGLLPVELHPDGCRTLLSQACFEQFEKVPPEERPPYPFLWQLQRRNLEETLQAFLEWEIETATGFIPTGFEVAFGFSKAAGAPVPLSLPSGEILYFQGRIDRIDRYGNRIRVIDYKTGRKRIKNESLAGGEALQLPVYLLAASHLYNLAEPAAAEAYNYYLSPTGVKTVLFSGEAWPQKEMLLQEAVEIIYKGIAAGHFFPYPNPGCRYCDYSPVCGPEIERTYRQKAADPLLAPFLKLKEDYA